VVGVIVLLYSVKTVAQNGVWKNNTVLYESGVETAPNSWRAQYLLAVEYTRQLNEEHDAAKKRELFNKAIDHFNSSIRALPGTAEAYVLKGYAFEFMGGYDDSAAATYRLALAIDPVNDKASINLGSVYLRQGNFTGAIKILTDVVARDSTNTEAITNLAASYGNTGHFPEALSYYAKALRINPDQPANVFSSLTNIYHYMGDSAKTQYYRQLLVKKLSEKK
jgi:tetratricopeptide (TPR) repeat protein